MFYIIFHFSAQMHSAHNPFIRFYNQGNHNDQLFIVRIWRLSLVRLENQKITFFLTCCSDLVTAMLLLTSKITTHKCFLYTGLCFALCQPGAASVIPRTTSLCPENGSIIFHLQSFNETNHPLSPPELPAKSDLCHLI